MKEFHEHILADFCVSPLGADISTCKYINETTRILKESGLNFHVHATGTNVEGSWDDVMNVIRKCHDAIHKMNCQRIESNIRLVSRIDKSAGIQETMGKFQ